MDEATLCLSGALDHRAVVGPGERTIGKEVLCLWSVLTEGGFNQFFSSLGKPQKVLSLVAWSPRGEGGGDPGH